VENDINHSYRLYRQPADGKRVFGNLYLCTDNRQEHVCVTIENQDYTIPRGRYAVEVTWSPRFKRLLPILKNVPGRDGIRIHRGTKPEHSKGCILVSADIEQKLCAIILKHQQNNEKTSIEIIDPCART
jgi:hypothetical protein